MNLSFAEWILAAVTGVIVVPILVLGAYALVVILGAMMGVL
jgi:hypothetical protein